MQVTVNHKGIYIKVSNLFTMLELWNRQPDKMQVKQTYTYNFNLQDTHQK